MGAGMNFCKRGHALTPENSRQEKSKECRGGFRIRCKTCIRLNYRRRYRDDEDFRKRALAYSRWFSRGHPEGKQWSEIKAQYAGDPA
ncbi:hypothetical protein SAMN05443248_2956 [Bradyrhizobium erythrophlei]|uniref:Uncharacterized protein n=1 Tax=Bradyrhizobium erythrophlei TaxID=1437360 RepID=A0A1M5NDZ9_9BRAD|nr:hypothetical protein SAMN05443248_2956 [Bradyrhizobium erythrophlei]